VKAVAALLAALACIAVLDCGPRGIDRAAAPVPADEPRWEDVIDTTPELLAVVFPTALRRDRVYGPLLRRAIDLVREQSRVVAETRALDAMEDAEEVIVGVRPDATAPGEAAGEVMVVVRGVRAEVDPVTLVDADGHALWAPGPSGRVRELVRSDSPPSPRGSAPIPASLFELPGRTWVIVSGGARARARAVFAHPLGRPALHFERFEASGDDPLAILRIDGPSLVARVHELQSRGGLAALGHRLQAVTLELGAGEAVLDPGDAGATGNLHRTIRALLSYPDDDAAALAEATARDVIGAIARKKPEALAWLADATVDRASPPQGGPRSILLTAPLPPRLVGALLHAGSAHLEAPTSPP
jgi:hypothetical protein